MIAYLEGKVFEVGFVSKQVYIVLLTQSGIGYQVFVPASGLYNVGENLCLYTNLQIREDSQTLYGFLKKEQKDLFEDVIQVSGVGPKVALGIISTFTAKELRKILLNADYKALSKVKGLGQKGAKKIVLELQGVYIENEEGVLSKDVAIFEELEDALGALGFQGKEVKKLIKKAEPFYKENNEISIEALIAYVLKN